MGEFRISHPWSSFKLVGFRDMLLLGSEREWLVGSGLWLLVAVGCEAAFCSGMVCFGHIKPRRPTALGAFSLHGAVIWLCLFHFPASLDMGPGRAYPALTDLPEGLALPTVREATWVSQWGS